MAFRLALAGARLAMLAPVGFIAGCHDLEASPNAEIVWAQNVGPIALPRPTGMHRVGRVATVWADASRKRVLPVWVYYPAIASDSAATPLLPDSAWTEVHRGELVRRFGPAGNALAAMTTRAESAAPVEATGRRFPVVIFAPDHGWLPTDYSALIEDLASRGFAVLTFAPPGDGGAIRFADGTVEPGSGDPSAERVAADMQFVAERLALLDREPGWLLAGALDLRHVAVAGAGTGGTAALLAAARDPAVFAAISLDGDFVNQGHLVVKQPLLYLSTEPPGADSLPPSQWGLVDRAERRRDESWAAVAPRSSFAIRIRLSGLYRGNLVDAALIPARALPPTLHETRVGRIDPVRGFHVVDDAVAAFLTDRIMGGGVAMSAAEATCPEMTIAR